MTSLTNMTTAKENGATQAFCMPDDENNYYEPGLTKREHFAAMAMQGIVAMYANPGFKGEKMLHIKTAADAVDLADALLKALAEQGDGIAVPTPDQLRMLKKNVACSDTDPDLRLHMVGRWCDEMLAGQENQA